MITQPQPRVRRQVPYGMEVKEFKAMHRRPVHPLGDFHYVPETAEEIARAERLTQKLTALLHDPDFDAHHDFVSMAENMMAMGRITEEQFLSINNEWHQVHSL